MEGKRRGSNVNAFKDAYVNAAMQRGYDVYEDVEARNAIIRDFIPYTLWLGWWVSMPSLWTFNAWNPWLKNYHGENGIGYRNGWSWAQYAWLDQDLKEESTGRR